MEQTLERGWREHHLWFSVFLRNNRCRFTRAQRLTTAMAMLYLSMLVNAMWYELLTLLSVSVQVK